jgi:hypothetical protein
MTKLSEPDFEVYFPWKMQTFPQRTAYMIRWLENRNPSKAVFPWKILVSPLKPHLAVWGFYFGGAK